MNKLSLYLKGILIGFCSLAVPGLSASTIAIVLVVYYDMIYAISHILKKPKQSISFLLVLLAGYFTGAATGAIAVNTLYDRFPIPVIAAVLGFIIASIPRMAVESRDDLKKWPNWVVMLTVGAVFLVYALVITNGEAVNFTTIRVPLDYILLLQPKDHQLQLLLVLSKRICQPELLSALVHRLTAELFWIKKAEKHC